MKVRIVSPSRYRTFKYGVEISRFGILWKQVDALDNWHQAVDFANKLDKREIYYPPFDRGLHPNG